MRRYCLLALVALVSSEAPRWVFPTPRSPSINRQRRGPCGVEDNDRFDDSVHYTEVNPGPLTVTWQEPVNNQGSVFRIALSRSNDDSYEECILLDNIPHNDLANPNLESQGSWTRYSVTVTIPDVNCDRCALQLLNIVVPGGVDECQYYAEDTENVADGRCHQSYHSCANLRISGGQYDRNDYTCNAMQDGWPWMSDGGIYAPMSNEHWDQGLLLEPMVPNHYRSTFANGATVLAWGTAVAVIANQDDDAMENIMSNTIMLRDRYLSLTNSRLIGLRFTDIDLPPEAEIVDARLKLFLDSNTTSSDVDFYISYASAANSLPFERDTPGNIADRPMEEDAVSARISPGQGVWESPPTNRGLQAVLANNEWASGNAITIILEPMEMSADTVKINTYESGMPAQLHVRYTLTRYVPVGPGTDRPTPSPTAPPEQPCTYAVRDRVMGNYLERGYWYHGRVDDLSESANNDPTQCLYTIVYDDGDRETEVIETNLREETTSPREAFQLRELVDVRVGDNQYKRGQIYILQANGLYTIETFDGEVYTDVAQEDMRQWVEWFVDDRVEIKQCWWYEAVIQDVLPDGRYQCLMDDGGYTAHVSFEEIRELVEIRYESGEIIQVYIDGDWRPGFVIQPNGDNTYMIGISGANRPPEMNWPAELMAPCDGC